MALKLLDHLSYQFPVIYFNFVPCWGSLWSKAILRSQSINREVVFFLRNYYTAINKLKFLGSVMDFFYPSLKFGLEDSEIKFGAKVIKYVGPYIILNFAFINNFVHSIVRHFGKCLKQIEITFISSKTFRYVLPQADIQYSAVGLVDEFCNRLKISNQHIITAFRSTRKRNIEIYLVF